MSLCVNDWIKSSLMSTQRNKDVVLGEEPDNPVQVSKAKTVREKKSFITMLRTR